MIKSLSGVLLIVVGCWSAGAMVSNFHKKEADMLRQLVRFVEYIICDLQFRLTPLPQLLQSAKHLVSGSILDVLTCFIYDLESQIYPNVSTCLEHSLNCCRTVSPRCKKFLVLIGTSLGNFDLGGQLSCLNTARDSIARELNELEISLPRVIKCCHAYAVSIGVILALLLL